MKKMILAMLLLLAPSMSRADGIWDMIKASLIDHVSAVSQVGDGHTKAAAVDSIIRIGKWNGQSILNLQAGFNKDLGEEDTTHLIYGGQIRLDPFITPKLNLPEHWVFLKNIEYGPAMHYDQRNSVWYGYFQAGWVFGQNPGQ